MRTDIFRMNLSIETISLFLCFEGLASYDPKVTALEVEGVWQGTKQSYQTGLKELENRNIIKRIAKKGPNNSVYKVVDHNQWVFRN